MFGISGSPSQRAATLLKALDIRTTGHATIDLGSPRYLVSDRRADLINRRDRLEAEGGAEAYGDGAESSGLAAWRDEMRRSSTTTPGAPPTAPPNHAADTVLAVGWFPREYYAAAVERWPDLAQRWDADDYGSYVRDIQRVRLDQLPSVPLRHL